MIKKTLNHLGLILEIRKYINDTPSVCSFINLLERRINVISKNIMALKKNKKLINVVHETK